MYTCRGLRVCGPLQSAFRSGEAPSYFDCHDEEQFVGHVGGAPSVFDIRSCVVFAVVVVDLLSDEW